MTGKAPQWGFTSRFYLPNEDAAVIRRALAELGTAVHRGVFVGGSGMALLDALPEMPELERVDFVDLADFQNDYFRRLLHAIDQADSSSQARTWFSEVVYPELRAHFLGRGQEYPLCEVLAALEKLFSIRFFFDDGILHSVQGALSHVRLSRRDILSHLEACRESCDFIYLSNVADYLPEQDLGKLFKVCRDMGAATYLLLTSACPDPAFVHRCWEENGLRSEAISSVLSKQNRGLGSHTLAAAWNRPGEIHLLTPAGN